MRISELFDELNQAELDELLDLPVRGTEAISARDILSNAPPAESMVMKMPITMPSAKRAQKLITLLRLFLLHIFRVF